MATAARAMSAEDTDITTGLPRGAMVCITCAVSWAPLTANTCWNCGRRGVSTAQAAARIRSAR